jgi:hypothetical protein
MARIKAINLRPQLWLVKVTVSDPSCVFSINPNISYDKLVKATNINSAVRTAATYCNRKMKEYPGTFFTYSTSEVKPYWYPLRVSYNEPSEKATFTRSKY